MNYLVWLLGGWVPGLLFRLDRIAELSVSYVTNCESKYLWTELLGAEFGRRVMSYATNCESKCRWTKSLAEDISSLINTIYEQLRVGVEFVVVVFELIPSKFS